MRGALGIGSSVNQLSAPELEEYASHISHYKKIRHIVQDGLVYRLQRLEEHEASIIQYVLSDGSEAVYSVAVRDHQNGWFRASPDLHGLIPDARYSVWNRHGAEVLSATGSQLMTLGIPGDAKPPAGFNKTLHIVRVGLLMMPMELVVPGGRLLQSLCAISVIEPNR